MHTNMHTHMNTAVHAHTRSLSLPLSDCCLSRSVSSFPHSSSPLLSSPVSPPASLCCQALSAYGFLHFKSSSLEEIYQRILELRQVARMPYLLLRLAGLARQPCSLLLSLSGVSVLLGSRALRVTVQPRAGRSGGAAKL